MPFPSGREPKQPEGETYQDSDKKAEHVTPTMNKDTIWDIYEQILDCRPFPLHRNLQAIPKLNSILEHSIERLTRIEEFDHVKRSHQKHQQSIALVLNNIGNEDKPIMANLSIPR